MRVGERRYAAASDRLAAGRVDEAAADAGHLLDVELGGMDAVDQYPLRVEDAELHQMANVGTAGLTQIFQKTLLQRECTAGNVGRDPETETPGQLIAAADQLFRAHAGGDPVRIRLDGHAETHQTAVPAIPARNLVFEFRQCL